MEQDDGKLIQVSDTHHTALKSSRLRAAAKALLVAVALEEHTAAEETARANLYARQICAVGVHEADWHCRRLLIGDHHITVRQASKGGSVEDCGRIKPVIDLVITRLNDACGNRDWLQHFYDGNVDRSWAAQWRYQGTELEVKFRLRYRRNQDVGGTRCLL